MGETQDLYRKAKRIIPGGTQLLSKRPEMFLPDLWPAYYSKAKGCEVWDLDGNKYYDTAIMGVGANVLGYAFDAVDNAAKKAIDNGGMCTLNAPEEVLLAEKLLVLHPWAGMVRYSKTGGEAMSIAVRIARSYTGRDKVLVCGYHGWHDWYLAANLMEGDQLSELLLKGLEPSGVPKSLKGTNLTYHYNNLNEFNALMDQFGDEIAAVVMEPIRNDYPDDSFLKEIRKLTQKRNIVLIFDEVTAGFRLCCGGSHMKLGVTPDIAVFAKGMTNGYPLSAIIGTNETMSAAQNTFISSTFWTERIALAATLASIEYFESNHVAEYLCNMGRKVQQGWHAIAAETGIAIKVVGIYPLSHFEFLYKNALAYKTFFNQEMLKQGFLATNAIYISYAHTEEIIEKYLCAIRVVFERMAFVTKNGKRINDYLETNLCHTGFERLN